MPKMDPPAPIRSIEYKLRHTIQEQLYYFNGMRSKYSFPDHGTTLQQLGVILYELKKKSIDAPAAVSRLAKLLKNDFDSIKGFIIFLPFGFRIDVQENDGCISCRSISSPETNELNVRMSGAMMETEKFVETVYDYSKTRGLEFPKFMHALYCYRKMKSNPTEEEFAEGVLDSDLRALLDDDILEQFRQLPFPDYLALISFHYTYLPKLQENIFDARRLENVRKLLKEVKEITKDKPYKLEKIHSTFTSYLKKIWKDDETANREEFHQILEKELLSFLSE